MRYLMILSLLIGLNAKASYIDGPQPTPKCYETASGGSVMKFEYEYKLGYSVVLIINNGGPFRQYFSKTFVEKHMASFEEIDCEAFSWELK